MLVLTNASVKSSRRVLHTMSCFAPFGGGEWGVLYILPNVIGFTESYTYAKTTGKLSYQCASYKSSQ